MTEIEADARHSSQNPTDTEPTAPILPAIAVANGERSYQGSDGAANLSATSGYCRLT